MEPITVVGSLYGARVDSTGEWKVTFSIPLTHGVSVAKITALTEKVFKIDISLAE